MNIETKIEFDKPYKMGIIKKAMISSQVLFDLLIHNKLEEIDKLLDYKLPKRIIQATDHFNNSILMAFLIKGHLKLAGKLITYFDEYIIYDQLNDNQNNALHICCQKNSFINNYKYQALVDFLIKKLPASLTLKNDVLKTPFFYSIENLDLHTFETLKSLKVENYLQKDIFSYNTFHAFYQHFAQIYSVLSSKNSISTNTNQINPNIDTTDSIDYTSNSSGTNGTNDTIDITNTNNTTVKTASHTSSNYNYIVDNFESLEKSIHTIFNQLMEHSELLYEVDEQNLTPLTYALKYVAQPIYDDNVELSQQQEMKAEFINIFEQQMLTIMKKIEQDCFDMKLISPKSNHFDNNSLSDKEEKINLIKESFLLKEESLLLIAKAVNETALLKDKYIQQKSHHIDSLNSLYDDFHTTLLSFMAADSYQSNKYQTKKVYQIEQPNLDSLLMNELGGNKAVKKETWEENY